VSVDLYVFLRDQDVPTRDGWQQAINASGVDLVLDNFNPREHTVYLPVKLNFKPTGFEYYFGSVEQELGVVSERIGDRDRVISFVLHGDFTELKAAMWAAAVLTKHASGIFYDPQSDEYAEDDGVFEIIRRDEAAEKERRYKKAAMDAARTERRCPKCGSPCPEYRNTCKACGFAIGRAL